MNNIILELRQKDSSHVIANGDYEVDLAQEIIVTAGNTISLKQSFIDITNSDQIVIPFDITVSTEHILYFTDWINDPNTKGNYVNNTGSSGVQGQGFSFVPNNVETGAPIVGYTTYVSLEWVSMNSQTSTSPAFQVTYEYIDITGHTNYLVKQIPEVYVNYQDNFSIIARTGSLFVLSPSAQELQNVIEIKYNNFDASPDAPKMDKYSPFIFNASFLLKAGSYDPLDLSLIISEQLSKNGVDEINHSKFLVNSPFLKTANQFDVGQPFPNSSSPTPTITNLPIFITTDVDGNLDQRMNFIGAASYFIGSSQIAIEYNISTQKFNWSYLHFPQYDNVAGNQISVNYIPTYGDTVMAIAKNGGIAFTNLSAVIAATNEPFDFWEGVLGFNLETMIAKPKTYNGLFAGIDGQFTYYHLIDGVNTTNGFVGIDTAIIKQAGQWYKEQPITSPFSSTIDTTINIVAEKSLNELLNKFSHFLISCDLKFTNDYIGTDNFLSVQGVVNKYMSYGAYLYSADDGSIMYQHMGAPIILKTIKCRILNSDKKIDKILGPDNTIIFEITKNMQPVEQQEAKK